MRYWILKAKPADYSYKDKLRVGREDNWERVTAYYGLQIGDRVFLWASTPQKYVAGLGIVVREAGAKLLRVRYLTEVLLNPPSIAELKRNAIFRDAPFLLPRQGTVFDLTREQGEELYRIVQRANPNSGVWGMLLGTEYFEDVEAEALEGRRYFATHLRRERNSQLAQEKKARFKKDHGALSCEACGCTQEHYGTLTGDIFDVHHRLPLSQVGAETKTRLKDLAVLCPNCHRAVHRTNPMLSVEALAKRLNRAKRLSQSKTA